MRTMSVRILVTPSDTRNKERVIEINEFDHYQQFRLIWNKSADELLRDGIIVLEKNNRMFRRIAPFQKCPACMGRSPMKIGAMPSAGSNKACT